MSSPDRQTPPDYVISERVRSIEEILVQSQIFVQLAAELRTTQQAFVRNEAIHCASITQHEALERRFSIFTDSFPQAYHAHTARIEALEVAVREQGIDYRNIAIVMDRTMRRMNRAMGRMEAVHSEQITSLERHISHVETLLERHIASAQQPPVTRGPRVQAPYAGRLRRSSGSFPPPPPHPTPEPYHAAVEGQNGRLGPTLPPAGPNDPIPYPDIPGGRYLAYFAAAARNASRHDPGVRPELPPTPPATPPFPGAGGVPYPNIPGGNFLPHFAAARNVSRAGHGVQPDVPPTTPAIPVTDGAPYPDIPGGSFFPHIAAARNVSRAGLGVQPEVLPTPPVTPVTDGSPYPVLPRSIRPAYAEPVRNASRRGSGSQRAAPQNAATFTGSRRRNPVHLDLQGFEDQELEWEELATWSAHGDHHA